ncbi:MAG: 30S ribosome-binding factor RbfA [Planctomycetota bacterium]
MTQRRLLKAAEAIREVVASAILTEIRDPRVKDVTVIGVEVTPDMREATVSVSVMGDEKQKTLSLRGLQNSAGFLQAKIAKRIDTRYTPRLQFELNRGAENAMVVGELLNKIRREQEVDSGEQDQDPESISPPTFAPPDEVGDSESH